MTPRPATGGSPMSTQYPPPDPPTPGGQYGRSGAYGSTAPPDQPTAPEQPERTGLPPMPGEPGYPSTPWPPSQPGSSGPPRPPHTGGYGGGGGGGSGGGRPHPGGTSGWAVASLIFGILWLCGAGSVLAIIFGAIALPRIRRSGQNGRGLAVAGIVLGVLGLLAAIGGALVVWFAADRTGTTKHADIVLEARSTGGVASGDVTYSFGSQTSYATGVSLPWSKQQTQDLSGLDILRVVVRNPTAGGSVTCRISVNHKVVKTATIDGAYANATCAYSKATRNPINNPY